MLTKIVCAAIKNRSQEVTSPATYIYVQSLGKGTFKSTEILKARVKSASEFVLFVGTVSGIG